MFDLKNLGRAINQIAEEKNIEPTKVIEAIESSIAAAYKKEYEKKGEFVRAKFNPKTGEVKFWLVKTAVDETTIRMKEEIPQSSEAAAGQAQHPSLQVDVGGAGEPLPLYNPDRHILLEEAKKIKPDVQMGEELEFPLEAHEDFGRIAAQTAKQVILQRLREAERDSIVKEFKDREGEIVSGIIQRFERGNVYIDLGRATGVMFGNESIPGEHYRSGDRIRFYVLAVQAEERMPGIILSRSHPKFVSKLLALEVPEITDGTVEIKAIIREPGSRTKVAVASKTQRIDPVGSCVGQRGTRVMSVSNELGQERIDIIEWSEDPAKYIGNALSPAKVKMVDILPKREARAYVADDQLSLAIGKGGQNVRLAAKLTGWKIDVRSQSKPEEAVEGGVAEAPPEPEAEPSIKPEFIEEIKKEE